MQWSMEEVDERIFVHVKHASREHAHIMIKPGESNVVIIVIANFNQLKQLNEIWIEFGAGKSLRFISIHQIARSLGPDKFLLFISVFQGV